MNLTTKNIILAISMSNMKNKNKFPLIGEREINNPTIFAEEIIQEAITAFDAKN